MASLALIDEIDELARFNALDSVAETTARQWAESGCQAISDPDAAVPVRLVAGVAAIVSGLDAAGAGLAEAFGEGGLAILSERAAALRLGRSGRASCNGLSRLMPAGDGWVAVTIARESDRQLLPAWLGISPAAACVVGDASPWNEIERRVQELQSDELVALGALLGLPCARLGESADPVPARVTEFAEGPSQTLRGLRVLNLGSLWAGPLCADVLRRLGADVVTVESVGRPDGGRATPLWFNAMHAGQRSVAVDLSTVDGVAQLRRLTLAADVVIEGSRPRALAQLGIDATATLAEGQTTAWVSITGHGRDPVGGVRVGLGDDAAAAGGLVGWVDGSPCFRCDAVADPITGLLAAAAVVELVSGGRRALIDIALSRVSRWLAPRPEDPMVAPLEEPLPARARRTAARSFTLGADDDEVSRDWLSLRRN